MAKGGSNSSTESRQDVDTTNVNLQEIDGTAIVGDGNTIIDGGAFEVVRDALETVEETSDDAFGFGRTAFAFADSNNRQAFDLVAGITGDAFSLAESATGDAIGEISRLSQLSVQSISDQVSRTVQGLNTFALEQAESSDDQLAGFGKIAILAVVATVVLPALLKG